jgi:hypothetical protein
MLDRTDIISVVVCTGLVAQFILPWAAIWLSDIFFFDIPPWLLWLLIGGPLAFSLLAILIHWAPCGGGQSSRFVPSHELQGR